MSNMTDRGLLMPVAVTDSSSESIGGEPMLRSRSVPNHRCDRQCMCRFTKHLDHHTR